MCYPVRCPKCGKTTWAGCGAHKEMVMRRVPPDQQCHCCDNPNQTQEVLRTETSTGNPTAIPHISTRQELQKHIDKAGNNLIVIDFFASWCAPCKLMAPYFEQLAKEFGPKGVVFLKVNGDDCQECVEQSGVSAFPTFHLLKCGRVVDEIVGVNKNGLRQSIVGNL